MKLKVLFILFISTFGTAQCQQAEEFREVKKHFDQQRALLFQEYNRVSNASNREQRAQLSNQLNEILLKFDSIQNEAYIGALIKVKNREDLAFLNEGSDITLDRQEVKKMSQLTPAEYPGGANALRKEFASLFYFNATVDEVYNLSSKISFNVTPEGYVKNVEAAGESSIFNRQSIIALYLLSKRFNPALENGKAVSYRYVMPSVMHFKP